MKEQFIKLTNAVYKVLEYFPESDPLKPRAKDKALAIMEHLILSEETTDLFLKEKYKTHISEDIDILLGYLWIAKSNGWVNSSNCLIIANEYENLRKGFLKEPVAKIIKTEKIEKTEKAEKKAEKDNKMSDRQEKILEFLNKNEKAQVMDLQTVLPKVTKRTIRRDLDQLLSFGKIVRLGEFNQVFYKVRG